VQRLIVVDHDSLTSVDGLGGLTELGGIFLGDNPMLVDTSGIAPLVQIPGKVQIVDNDSLVAIGGFESVADIGLELRITDNDSLATFGGFGSLTELGGDLLLQNNPLASTCEAVALRDQLTIFLGTDFISGNLDDGC
jgi:hypothetical protein